MIRLCTAAASLPTLPHRSLPYRAILLDYTADKAPDDFAKRLAPSLAAWRAEGMKSCMLKLPLEQASLAEIAAENSFVFHHVPLGGNGGREVVLKCWLQDDLPDKVPPLCTHQVGIAGLVIDAQQRILVVKEWRARPDLAHS